MNTDLSLCIISLLSPISEAIGPGNRDVLRLIVVFLMDSAYQHACIRTTQNDTAKPLFICQLECTRTYPSLQNVILHRAIVTGNCVRAEVSEFRIQRYGLEPLNLAPQCDTVRLMLVILEARGNR